MRVYFALLLLLSLLGCTQDIDDTTDDSATLIYQLNDRLTEAVILGILPPPTAARIYAYANIAAYEVSIFGMRQFKSLAGQVNDLEAIPQPDINLYLPDVAVVDVFCNVAVEGVYHDYILENYRSYALDSLGKLYPEKKFNYTLAFSDSLSKIFISWLHKDGLKEIRKMPDYQLLDEEWAWEPTPPKYTEALEPWWHKLRPFILDSTSQYRPNFDPNFSKEKDSYFYKEALKVHNASEEIMGEDTAIANFWDCNPFLTERKGHITYTIRQISPGGHWMGITKIVARKMNLSLREACEIYALTSIALSDAFVSTWEAKYHYHLIRPETYINRYIDPHWQPLLETPPFPEYPSAHSAISASAATVLKSYFGETFTYTDSVEVPFGKTPRSFSSFRQASDEAAISRLYGGIHYMFGVNDGVIQGNKVGQQVLNKIRTRNDI